jgi:flavoprotein hydroxylase
MPADGGAVETFDADVLIVGYGPVGQVLALLLAQRGHRVTVIERWDNAYPMPRAVAFDSEGARILATAGIGEFIGEVGEPSGEYRWENAAGQTLLEIEVDPRGHCGWPESTSMYQPGLEATLTARGDTLPALTVLRGWRVTEVDEDTDGVTVTFERDSERRTLTAGWIVGCDGANSFVRNRIGARLSDLGFSHDWLICDVRPHEPVVYRPNNLQICDPARPRTSVSAGPGHRRWEFMRSAGETVEELNTPESAWRLLKLFDVHEHEATLERHHVYTFSAGQADRWRSGRMLIAGDAAHVMPPFAGQGMSSGFRDAAALAWRLDAVLAGRAGAQLLDSYEPERKAHVAHAIGMSVNLGRIICQTDARAAADRDQVMMAMAARPAPGASGQRSAVKSLSTGLLRLGAGGRPARPAGELMPQGRVSWRGRTGFFDDVVGRGFVLLGADDPAGLLDDACIALLNRLDAHVAGFGGPEALIDEDGRYAAFFAATGVRAVLIRPDFYVYGGAATGEELTAMIRELTDRMAPAI